MAKLSAAQVKMLGDIVNEFIADDDHQQKRWGKRIKHINLICYDYRTRNVLVREGYVEVTRTSSYETTEICRGSFGSWDGSTTRFHGDIHGRPTAKAYEFLGLEVR